MGWSFEKSFENPRFFSFFHLNAQQFSSGCKEEEKSAKHLLIRSIFICQQLFWKFNPGRCKDLMNFDHKTWQDHLALCAAKFICQVYSFAKHLVIIRTFWAIFKNSRTKCTYAPLNFQKDDFGFKHPHLSKKLNNIERCKRKYFYCCLLNVTG